MNIAEYICTKNPDTVLTVIGISACRLYRYAERLLKNEDIF